MVPSAQLRVPWKVQIPNQMMFALTSARFLIRNSNQKVLCPIQERLKSVGVNQNFVSAIGISQPRARNFQLRVNSERFCNLKVKANPNTKVNNAMPNAKDLSEVPGYQNLGNLKIQIVWSQPATHLAPVLLGVEAAKVEALEQNALRPYSPH